MNYLQKARFLHRSKLLSGTKNFNMHQISKLVDPIQIDEFLKSMHNRFVNNMHRHKNIVWENVLAKLRLEESVEKLWSLYEMENSGGEPDIVDFDKLTGEFIFFDCSEESPKGRRSLCYDQQALESRKENKPQNSALGMSVFMGIELLSDEQYRYLQTFGNFDTKTSSWLKTPEDIRILGGAIFGDRRYNKVFTYHNGAESYYAARGFRAFLKV